MTALEQDVPKSTDITRAVINGPAGSSKVLELFLSVPDVVLDLGDRSNSSAELKGRILDYLQQEGYKLFPEIPCPSGLGVRYLEAESAADSTHQCMLSLKIIATDGTLDDRVLAIAQRLRREGKLSDPTNALTKLSEGSGLSRGKSGAYYQDFMTGLEAAIQVPVASEAPSLPPRS